VCDDGAPAQRGLDVTRPEHGPTRIDAAAVREALREAGTRARHALSQNFLVDVDVLEDIIAVAAPTQGRRVLEIGPGLGILTGALLGAGAAVTAIELDRILAHRLADRFADALGRAEDDPSAAGGLRLIEGDALDQDLAGLLEPPYDIVANLPYHITSPILHAILGRPPRPERAILMLQREVAERVCAPPGAMSYLSVFVQYHARARIVRRVPREAFAPAPAVDSALVVIEPFTGEDADLLSEADEDHLWRIVQASFRERRKMLHNVLARQLPVDAARVEAALAEAGIASDRRPQTVAVGEWLAFRAALGPIGPDVRGRRTGR
jgi:16S rRNA (adenine1518-N6/adenine1519-N6)-dimethyltransferase